MMVEHNEPLAGDPGAEAVQAGGCVGSARSIAVPPEADPPSVEALTEAIVCALKTVYDPEIPVDIYELGLIYRVELSDDVRGGEREADVEMTLTAPGCPVADWLVSEAGRAVGSVDGVGAVRVRLVFDPPWDPSLMSDEARFVLNMF